LGRILGACARLGSTESVCLAALTLIFLVLRQARGAAEITRVTAAPAAIATCLKEAGFTCSQDADCEKTDGECVLRVPALFRDFNAANSDKSKAVVGDIVLFKKAIGGFVNRWGAMGEQWTAITNEAWAANTYAECQATGCTLCSCNPNQGCTDQGCTGTLVAYDGTPFFFPLDSRAEALLDTRGEAKVGPDYGFASWPWEKSVVPGAGTHNFHFTTEVKYWFQYDAGVAATLDFTGDDDVWVFVNGKLAVDIGGVHPPQSGSVTIAAANAASYGLADGKVYAISIFHAERKAEGSSFRLTLDGFNTARSFCTGAYCGDGIEQPGEDCDDGNRLDGDGCGSACRNVVVK
jgi:fibro-slime domain-containing protein